MPDWVCTAIEDFSKRLQEFCHFSITEIPLQKRSKQTQINQVLEKESKLILNSIPKNSYCIALNSIGKSFTSQTLAEKVSKLQLHDSQWCFVIGGPEGLSKAVLERAQESWSLSQLTLAHPLARIVLCEALYRSFAILNNHPYHK